MQEQSTYPTNTAILAAFHIELDNTGNRRQLANTKSSTKRTITHQQQER